MNMAALSPTALVGDQVSPTDSLNSIQTGCRNEERRCGEMEGCPIGGMPQET